MTCINLLPWREMQRKERRRQFASIAGGTVVLMAAIILYVHLHVSGLIDNQNARNNYLQGEIKKVDAQIAEIKDLETQREKLLARMNIIQQLQANRPLAVHLLDELVKTKPDGVYLTHIQQKGAALTLDGMAQSNARVSAFMRNLDASKWLDKPRLDVIKAVDDANGERDSQFKLRVSQIGESDPAADNAAKPGAKPGVKPRAGFRKVSAKTRGRR